MVAVMAAVAAITTVEVTVVIGVATAGMAMADMDMEIGEDEAMGTATITAIRTTMIVVIIHRLITTLARGIIMKPPTIMIPDRVLFSNSDYNA
jgi:hypothetical protein